MKKLKFLKQTNFTPPRGKVSPEWMKKFQEHTHFKTKYGYVIYKVTYANYHERWNHAEVCLEPTTNRWKHIYICSEYQAKRYLPYEI